VADDDYVTYITGWIQNADEVGTWNVTTAEYTDEAPEGENVAYVYNGNPGAGVYSSISQVLSSRLQADSTYVLDVDVGFANYYTAFPGYRIELLAGGVLLVADDNSNPPAQGTFSHSQIVYQSGPAPAQEGQNLEIRLIHIDAGGTSANEVEFDDVRLSAFLATPDTNAPAWVSAIGKPDLVSYVVTFDEDLMDDSVATNPSNWSLATLDGMTTLPVQSVSINRGTVVLRTAAQRNPAESYNIMVLDNVVRDLLNNALVAPDTSYPITPTPDITILNPGFELQRYADGDYGGTPQYWETGSVDGDVWMPGGIDAGAWNITTAEYPNEAPEGDNVVYVYDGSPGDGSVIGLRQVLVTTLQPNTTYQLTVQVGFALYYDDFPGYRVELVAGEGVLAADNNSTSPDQGTFITSTVNYTTPANSTFIGEPLEIRLLNIGGGGASAYEVEFDDVSLSLSPSTDFSITDIVRDPTTGNVTLTWDSKPSKNYAIDISTDLGSWTELVTGISSQGDETSYTDEFTGGVQSIRFYQLRELE
jgi:hypothetical protein